jgi:putative hydrolase of the HAD superfamily
MAPFQQETDDLRRDMQAEKDLITSRSREETGKPGGANWTDLPLFLRRTRANDRHAIIGPEALAAAKAAGRKRAIFSNEFDLFHESACRQMLPKFLEQLGVDCIAVPEHADIHNSDVWSR